MHICPGTSNTVIGGPYLIFRHQRSEVLISWNSVNCQSQDKLVCAQYTVRTYPSFVVSATAAMSCTVLGLWWIWVCRLRYFWTKSFGVMNFSPSLSTTLAYWQGEKTAPHNSQEIFRDGKVSVSYSLGYTPHVTCVLWSSVPHVIHQLCNYHYNGFMEKHNRSVLSNISLSLCLNV